MFTTYGIEWYFMCNRQRSLFKNRVDEHISEIVASCIDLYVPCIKAKLDSQWKVHHFEYMYPVEQQYLDMFFSVYPFKSPDLCQIPYRSVKSIMCFLHRASKGSRY